MKQDIGEEPPVRADIAQGLRLLVLLRLTVEKASEYKSVKKTFFVPFLLDTGSPQTFLCKDDYDKLGIGDARNTYIEGKFANPCISSGHFEDINLLGTDVLRKTNLFVDYQAGKLHLGFFDQGARSTSSIVWVRELIRKGRGSGRWFGAARFGYSLLAVFLQVCCQFMPAIKQKTPNRVMCDADDMNIYSQKEDGGWEKEETMSASLRSTSEPSTWYR
ncbi:hypothetical protein AK812_SmicGene39700 [Symbiodinium microadriaticum]|uniref:Uncharacterized protein n=1 Tax=Symbiodinium microadriaticum TaxID=2951 RepID=A0A1Q9CAL6_SYMMI|nr:hypothetical protein AK812_SmicGene39700 [Symbiodinium microadriaticum]